MNRLGVSITLLIALCGLPALSTAGVIASGVFPDTLSENTTGTADSRFLGPPDQTFFGLGDAQVIYDFAAQPILNGPGPDFNVYEESAIGGQEFASIDVLVSEDGVSFVSVKASEGDVRRIDGDEAFDATDEIFTGPPDNDFLGIGNASVLYDFGSPIIVDGAGPDFNVYEESVVGAPEFASIDVLVSADGAAFTTVKGSESSVVRIPGDEALTDDEFARSYDLAAAGLFAIRFVFVDGLDSSPACGNCGFDLDAIGAINLVSPSLSPYPDMLSENAAGASFARSYDIASVGLSVARFVRIEGLSPVSPCGNCGFDLDAIGAISRVPEPTTFAVMCLGLICLGFMRFPIDSLSRSRANNCAKPTRRVTYNEKT